MLINRRIKLGDRNFYISCECEYNKKDGYIALELKNYKDKYYDDGDLSILIEKIENNYDDSTYKKYDTEKWLVSDCLYIYDNIPFISGVGDYKVSPVDGNIVSTTYISNVELDDFIKNNNIEMNDKNQFKLVDERTWFLK